MSWTKHISGVLWSLLLIVLILGFNSLLSYNIEQSYVTLSTDQVSDNSMYYDLRNSQSTVKSIISLVTTVLIAIVVIFSIKKIFKKKPKE